MNRYNEFIKWFNDYFCDTQTDDSPFSYNDVKQAYYHGWEKYKSFIVLAKKDKKPSEVKTNGKV